MTDRVNAPVSALAGVSEGDAQLLQQAFNIKTIGGLGRNKVLPCCGQPGWSRGAPGL